MPSQRSTVTEPAQYQKNKMMEHTTIKAEKDQSLFALVRPLQDFAYLLITLLLIALLYYAAHHGSVLEQQLLQQQERDEVRYHHLDIMTAIERVFNHLNGLSRERELLQLVEQPDLAELQPIEQAFTTLLLRNPDYFQARWIDGDGIERVRVDRQGTGVRVVDTLQNKSTRYYTLESLKLAAGQFYLSQVDLNVEHGEIVTPHQPTLRIARRLPTTKTGVDAGFLIINLDLTNLIAHLRSSFRSGGWLVNQHGQWLVGPDPEHEWSFMFGRSHDVEDRFPDLSVQMVANASLQKEDAHGGLLTV